MHLGIIFVFALFAIAHSKLINLSCQQIHDFVDGHNSRRLQLVKGEIRGQPAASNMKLMVWDDELAAKAAKWASRNQFAHNPDKTIGSGRFSTGENIYYFATTDSSSKVDIDLGLSSWFNEYKDYTYGPLSNSHFDGSLKHQIGHYTQMAWADTTYVGCGVSEYMERNMKKFLVVCNYGPAGNFLGQTPYQKGSGGKALLCSVGDCNRRYGDKC